ncbi:MAG TPA: sigma 54-interacting transcriptional regulator [Candidatus Krumholzibacteria bacterium]|nr:sigma 54-interacting transcriptional regulator [Candidatus Krumholzibacteria bacterium]
MTRPLDSRRLYEQLFTSAPLAVAFLDRDLRYLRVNEVMARANGASPEAHVGRGVADMSSELADELTSRYRQVLASGRPLTDQEIEQTDAEGRRRIWLAGSFPVLDDDGAVAGICTVAQDITARKQAEAVMADTMAFQTDFIDKMPGYILLLDEDGRIRRWNRGLQERLARPAEDLEGRYVVELARPEDRLRVRHAIAECLESGTAALEAHYQSQTGVTQPTWGMGVRLELLGRPHICVLVEDITEQAKVRESLELQLRFQSLMAAVSGELLASAAGDVASALERNLPAVAAFFGAERMTVWEQDRAHARLRPCAVWGLEGMGTISKDMTSDDFPDTVERVLAGEPVFFQADDEGPAPDDGPSQTYLYDHQVRSSILVPVMAEGQVAAVLAMGTVTHRAGWNDDDLERARVVAGAMAAALKRRDTEQDLADAVAHIAHLKDRLEEEYTVLREEISLRHAHDEIVGAAPVLRETLYRAEQVAVTDVTVLIHGETGTGKELIARAVHRASRRHSQPLVTVNCAALPPALIESELFGHERGAFTGADTRRAGRFEIAHGGTLFLDEVGELPLDLQAKLLRVLQLGEFERLGSSVTQKVDVRIIAATNRDLEAEVAAGRFREDLWYRLNVFPLRVPPLRERREDIPALTGFFLERLVTKLGRPSLRLPRTVLDALQAYDWPGNVRELENVIERGVITSTGGEFRLADPLLTRGRQGAEGALRPLADVERDHLARVLKATGWRIEGPDGAAAVLGLNPSTLRSRLRKHGLRRPRRTENRDI